MIRIIRTEGPLVECEVGGRITHEDYEGILPDLEKVIAEHGALRCVVRMGEIEWIQPRAIMDDLTFDVRHAGDREKVALVTDTRWQEWVTRVWGALLPTVAVKCFAPEDFDQAEAWARA